MRFWFILATLCLWVGAAAEFNQRSSQVTLFAVLATEMWVLYGIWMIGNRLTEGRRERRRAAGLCVACGYDLTGNTSGVCPECGTRASFPT